MKKVIMALLCLYASIFAAHAQEQKVMANELPTNAPLSVTGNSPIADAGKLLFDEETHDYGKVPEGPVAGYDFAFKNTGKKPIQITEAHGSCGCTVPQWPKGLIRPGEGGVIHVDYTTAGHPGNINKDVIISSNAEQTKMILHIKGTVEGKVVDLVPEGKK